MSFKVPTHLRVRTGHLASDESYENNGAFIIPSDGKSCEIFVIASDGGGWDHVSARPLKKERTLNWEEMHHIRLMFWGPEDCVVQFHPPRSEYVNFNPHVLHLWRPQGYAIATPPSWMVGPQ